MPTINYVLRSKALFCARVLILFLPAIGYGALAHCAENTNAVIDDVNQTSELALQIILASGTVSLAFLCVLFLFSMRMHKNAQHCRAVILENISDAIVLIDQTERIRDINSVACKIVGLTKNEALNQSVHDILRVFTADGRVSVKEMLHQALTCKCSLDNTSGHYILVDRNGHEYNINYHFCPGPGRGEALFIFRDINEHLVLEDQLRQAQKLESVGRLAGGIAHDFNNLIGAISGTAEVMMLQLEEDDGLMRYVRRIFATATKAADLTTRLLSFTRKGVSGVSASFSLNNIVREAVEIIERSMDPKVEVRTTIAESDHTIIGDPSGIENAIINLCLNANDAMPKGGQLTITITQLKLDEAFCGNVPFEPTPGEYAVITVADTGSGISPDKLKKIYEPFYTTKGQGKGSGLGLAAVYNTIKEHRGTITVESEVGAGTTFCLYLPLASDQAPQRLTPENANPIRRGSGTVLLVDDEEFMRDAGKLMLESLGYQVLLAENGKEAVDIYREKRKEIDIVILDMVMPRMNGSDAFKLIVELNPAAKVLIASGFARETGITTLFSKGLKAFVKKPYRQSEIAEILADIMEED